MHEKDLHPLVTVSNINPEDIPDVPVNKFLMRGANAKDKNDYKSRGIFFHFKEMLNIQNPN